jgi:hypothetical protein
LTRYDSKRVSLDERLSRSRLAKSDEQTLLATVVKSLRRFSMLAAKHALCFGHGYEAYSNGFEGSRHPDRDRTVIRAQGSYFRGVRGNCGWINLPYGFFIRLVQEVIR